MTFLEDFRDKKGPSIGIFWAFYFGSWFFTLKVSVKIGNLDINHSSEYIYLSHERESEELLCLPA